MSGQQGPRDWLSGGRHWDEIPTGGAPYPPPRGQLTYRLPDPAPHRKRSWLWSLLSFAIGGLALFALYASSVTNGQVTPALSAIAGVVAVVFGIIGWRRRRSPGNGLTILLPALSIAAGVLSIATAAALTGVITTNPTSPALAGAPAGMQAVAPAPTPSATPTETSAGSAPAAPAVQIPAQPPATQMSMAQTLGTLQFALKLTRGPDGLQSPALAVTSAGGVFDPFSATPNRILAVLPQNTTLSYTVSVDRLNYAVTLTDAADPSLVARFDTVNGRIQFG